MFVVPGALRGDLNGVEAVSFSVDGATVFIKALQQGFDEDLVKSLWVEV